MLATLARHYDCGIHPAYCVRLSCNRYRLTIEDKLALPRLAEDAEPRVGTVLDHFTVDADGLITRLAIYSRPAPDQLV